MRRGAVFLQPSPEPHPGPKPTPHSPSQTQLAAAGAVVSYGADWEVTRLRPFLFHVRLRTWRGFHWAVNTSRREAYEVRGGRFGRIGGCYEPLDFVRVQPVLDCAGLDRFLLRFRSARLVHLPASRSLQFSSGGRVLSYCQDWQAVQLRPYLFEIRQRHWRGFFWKINTSRREAYLVRNGSFGNLGGTHTALPVSLRISG